MTRFILGALSVVLGLLGLLFVVGNLVHFAQYGVIDGSALGLLAHTDATIAQFSGREPSVLSVFGIWFLTPAAFLIVGIWMIVERSHRRK